MLTNPPNSDSSLVARSLILSQAYGLWSTSLMAANTPRQNNCLSLAGMINSSLSKKFSNSFIWVVIYPLYIN